MRAGEFVSEIGAPGELTVSEKLQKYFTDRGYDIAGEGRDQMVFHKPGQRHVVKVIGLGDDLARRDNVADYVRFFAINQRNPHFPRVSQPREIQIGDEIYTIYRQELLQGLPGEEVIEDWMEKFGAALSDPARARTWLRENPPPPNLPRQQVQGLYTAVRRLQQFYGDDLGGSIRLDLGHTGNFMQRADGTIVVVDPLAYDESYDTYSESAPVANEDLAGTLKKGLASAALAGTMAMGSPAAAAEPPPMTTVAVVTIDGETRQYNLGTRFKDSREALRFVDDVLKRQGLSGYDINIRRGVAKTNENFADGRVKGKSRPGRVKRSGASCKGSVTDLRARAKKYGGERGRMYHWCANMKSGRKK